jgi:ribosomal protein S4
MSNINKKNKLWTAGFVKIRKLRQYYGKQLQSTNKLLYWLGDPSYRQLRKALNKIYTHAYSNIMPWSIIQFLDSLWTNLQIKANFVYYSSASPNVLKQKKMRYNGLIIQRPYGFCEAGDLIYTKKKV